MSDVAERNEAAARFGPGAEAPTEDGAANAVCHLCADGLEHCHEVSIEHTDGSTECGGDRPCPLDHLLHEWRLPCAELVPPCPCAATQGPSVPLAA